MKRVVTSSLSKQPLFSFLFEIFIRRESIRDETKFLWLAWYTFLQAFKWSKYGKKTETRLGLKVFHITNRIVVPLDTNPPKNSNPCVFPERWFKKKKKTNFNRYWRARVPFCKQKKQSLTDECNCIRKVDVNDWEDMNPRQQRFLLSSGKVNQNLH